MNPRIAAIVVTRNRPVLLARCLDAVWSQELRPDLLIVVDNASDRSVEPVLSHYPGAILLCLAANFGPAAAFGRAIREALAVQADLIWMMDDDGVPADRFCLAALLATARREHADLVSPLIRDIDRPERLAFPIRRRGRTRFCVATLGETAPIEGFAHLFNGALVRATTFLRAGLPNPRLFIRGDEVEFLLRLRRHGLRVLTDPAVAFLHPGSNQEIRPILGGRFYAVVPDDPVKKFHQFRNRGWIFARYGMWGWLAADHVRYACWYLAGAHDPAGYALWLRLTWAGVLGRLDPYATVVARPQVPSPA